MRKISLIAISCVIALTGCQTTRYNAVTGEKELSNTVNGAAAGCVIAGIVGAAINGGRGATTGCALGLGIGAYAGSEMDQQEAALKRELQSTGVQVTRKGDSIRLVLLGDISFSTGSANLSNSIKPSLKSVVNIMNRFPDTVLQVDGHTDSVGKADFNQQLSFSRARAVSTYLHGSGLAFRRTNVNGFGESMPLCSNTTAEGRRCNRRVELTIVPL